MKPAVPPVAMKVLLPLARKYPSTSSIEPQIVINQGCEGNPVLTITFRQNVGHDRRGARHSFPSALKTAPL
jgi:hypothetical protein